MIGQSFWLEQEFPLVGLDLRSFGQEVSEVALTYNASVHQGDRRKTSQMCNSARVSALAIDANI